MTTVRLGDVVSVTGGGTPRKSSPEYFGGGIPWVTPQDMKRPVIGESEITLTELGVQASPAKIVPAGSALVVVRSGILKHSLPVALTNQPVTVNQDMKALTPSHGLDARFLTAFMRHSAPVVLSWVRATTADNFPVQKLLDLRLDLPSLEEQRRIAAILDQADAIRTKRRQVLTSLDALPAASFRATEAQDWPVVELGDLISSQQIGLDRRGSDQGPDRAHDYVKMDAITRRGSLDLTAMTRVDADPDTVAKYSLQDGDLILNTRNSRELVGKSAIYRGGPRLYNNNIMRIRFVEPYMADYVHAFLWSGQGIRALERIKSGTTSVFAVYGKDLVRLRIPVADCETRQAYAALVAETNECSHMVTTVLAKDDELFASLQSRAFRGEL